MPSYDELVKTIRDSTSQRTQQIEDAISSAMAELTGGYMKGETAIGDLKKSGTYDPVKQAGRVWGGMAPTVQEIISSLEDIRQRGGGGYSHGPAGREMIETTFNTMLPQARAAAKDAEAGMERLTGQEVELGVQKGRATADLGTKKSELLSQIQEEETRQLAGALRDEISRGDKILSSLLPFMQPETIIKKFPGYGLDETLIRKSGYTPAYVDKPGIDPYYGDMINGLPTSAGNFASGTKAGGGTGTSTSNAVDDTQLMANLLKIQSSFGNPNYKAFDEDPFQFGAKQMMNKNINESLAGASNRVTKSTRAPRQRYF